MGVARQLGCGGSIRPIWNICALAGDKLKRGFNRAWTSLLAGAAILCAMPAAPVLAAGESVFTVGNYPVQAQAKNAVTAKEQAISDGQQNAFRSLLKRIVPVTSYSSIERLRSVKATDYISAFSVRSESNSNTEYIASLDFSFRPDAVRNLLRRESVPFIDTQAPVVVLVPVMRDAAGGGAGDNGKWTRTWRGLDLEHTLTPARLENLKPEVHPDTVAAVVSGDGNAVRILNGEYRANAVVVALAEYDAASKRLDVTLAGQDAVGPLAWKRSYRLDSDLDYTMELAAVIALGVLEGRWKSVKVEGGGLSAAAGMNAGGMGGGFGGTGMSGYGQQGGGFGQQVTIDVQFNSVEEWDDMRRQILETPGVEDVAVGSITARSAEVSLQFPGGGAQLASVLAPHGLTLRNMGPTWVLHSGY